MFCHTRVGLPATGDCSGVTTGAAGGTLSTVTLALVEATFPAASVAVATTVCAPLPDVAHVPAAEPAPAANGDPSILIAVLTTPEPLAPSEELAATATLPRRLAPLKIAAENTGALG